MFVKEFNRRLTSADLNAQLQKVYSWSLNLNEMTNVHANGVLKNMRGKLQKIKESSKAHFAEKNPQYMEALLVTQILETLIDESYSQQLQERELKKAELAKREKYVKGMKKVKGDFEQQYPGRGENVMYATATKMAKKKSVDEAMSVLRAALSGNEPIMEGEYDQAAAIVAARDMVDTIQDMVEKLSKLANEDLVALADVMRNEIGQSQSDAFVQAAQSAINPLLDQAKAARQGIDNAARAAAGEPMAPALPPVSMTPGSADLPMPPEPEMDATADSASGGNLEFGRSKR
jgi:hypothetical protein